MMEPTPEFSPKPKKPENIITGIDQLIMTKMATYIDKHPEQTIENKKEAFAYTFGVIQSILRANKDAPIEDLLKAYKMMKIGIEFTPEQDRSIARFLRYFEKSREYTKSLEYLPRLELFKILTGIDLGPEDRKHITIRRGPFGFIIETNQRIINIIRRGSKPKSFLEEFKEKLNLEPGAYGLSHFASNPQDERIKTNFVVVPKKEAPITATLEESLSDLARLRMYLDEDITFKMSSNSIDKILAHEEMHNLFNIVENSYRYEKPIDVQEEILRIIRTRKPDLVTEKSFREFCEYLTTVSFNPSAADETIATLGEQGLQARFTKVRDRKFYDFSTPFQTANLTSENDFIATLYNGLFNQAKNKNADKFFRIFLEYSSDSAEKINHVITLITYAIDKYNLNEERLANLLLFEDFENWIKTLKSVIANPNSSIRN